MIKFEDILSAVITKLKTGIPGIKVKSQDIEEGFKRPSFFVELDNIKIDDFMRSFQERKLTVRISYFPTDKNKNQLELLKMRDSLNETFIKENLIYITEDMVVEVEKVNIVVVDKILHFDFKIYLSEEYEREITNELMEELHMNEEVNNVN